MDTLTQRRSDLLPGAAASESSQSAVSWPAVVAGAFVAAAVSLVLITLGSGFGLASVSAWPGGGVSAKTFTVMTAIWLIVVQWLASGMGGYVAGRLRTKWVNLHTHEVFFRDTANGLITWAVATIFITVFVAATVSLATHVGVQSVEIQAGAGTAAAAAEEARKAAAEASIFTGLSMLVGAFIACIAAALGGHRRDVHP